jgi:hypothetical protein
MSMIVALSGLVVWLSLAAMAWKCATEWATSCPDDRAGNLVFFIVVGLPLVVAGMGMIGYAIKA